MGYEFPTLDFIICLQCAQDFPQMLKKAVEDATGVAHLETFLEAAQAFAIDDGDPVAHLLNCERMECQKPLVLNYRRQPMSLLKKEAESHQELPPDGSLSVCRKQEEKGILFDERTPS